MNYEEKISTGLLHCHTEHSLMDSTLSVEDLVKTASELGAKAVALTDHGTMTGMNQFRKAAKAYGVLPIIGMEAYIAEENESRLHLILMGIDSIGVKAIGKFATLSNTRLKKVGKLRFPEGNTEMLIKCFGEGTEGHGHVIATSACVGGVLAGLNFRNEDFKKEYTELHKDVKDAEYVITAIQANETAIKRNKEEIEELDKIASQKFGAREKFIKKISNDAERLIEISKLDIDKKNAEKAAVKIKELKAENNARSKKNTQLNKKIAKHNDINFLIKRYNELNTRILTETELVRKMEDEALRYEKIFGKGNFYIEVQYHGIPEEQKYMHILVDIAERNNIPYVAANDVHMAKKEDFAARETIKTFRFNKWEYSDESDRELYIKTDKELFEALAFTLGKERADKAMQNISTIVNRCVDDFKHEDHYPKFDKNRNADEILREMVYANISKKFSKEEWTEIYAQRLEYELSVIIKMGYSDYHLIDQDFINITKKMGNMPEERFKYLTDHVQEMSYQEMVDYIEADQSNIGYVIGPGRGSAAGSLVCYLLGITDIDPIKYGLLFERFLNPERVSMPDIDTDFANGYRDLAVEYVSKKYGKNATCRIVTAGTMAARGSIRSVARVLGTKKDNDEEHYNHLADILAKRIPVAPNVKIVDYINDMSGIFNEYPEAKEIVDKAMAIEGTFVQYGMHAAGVIISDNDDVSDYVPLMIDEKSGNWKCQCDMVEAEENGLLKMDFLGLKNLNIITDTIRLIFKNKGIKINPDKDIIEEVDVIKSILSTGNTNSIFQFESGGMKSMLKQFKPDSFEDLILLVAAYRPGPMDFIPQMIEVKHGKHIAEYSTPVLEPILAPTYGCIIYQEQVQQIFQVCAGYSLGQADLVRRAMSKKKEKVLLAERQSFIFGDVNRNIDGCLARGITEEVANNLFDSMVSFAKYAFNKSHAAAYARISYMTAWLKYYYPTEYLCVAMEYASQTKIPGLIEECKNFGIKVLPVDINKSVSNFTADNDKNIYFGITSIKEIGNVDKMIEARTQKPFISFSDYILRGHFDKTVTNNLIKVGAFDKFCNNRKALLIAAEIMIKYLKIVKDQTKKINELQQKLGIVSSDESEENKKIALEEANIKFGKNLPKVESVEKSIKDAQEKIKEAMDNIQYTVIPVEMSEDYEERLNEEKELMGVYITGHPLDAYELSEKSENIYDLSIGKNKNVVGIIRKLKIVQRKKDGADMAFIEIEDKTGFLDAVCFAKNFETCSEFLKEGAVLEMSGSVVENTTENISINENGEEEVEVETKLQLYINSCKPMVRKTKDIIIEVPNLIIWTDVIRNQIKPFEKENGFKLVIFDKLFKEMRRTTITVSPEIKNYYKSFIK